MIERETQQVFLHLEKGRGRTGRRAFVFRSILSRRSTDNQEGVPHTVPNLRKKPPSSHFTGLLSRHGGEGLIRPKSLKQGTPRAITQTACGNKQGRNTQSSRGGDWAQHAPGLARLQTLSKADNRCPSDGDREAVRVFLSYNGQPKSGSEI